MDKVLVHFSTEEALLIEAIIGILKNSPGLCLSLDELAVSLNIRRGLLTVYLNKMADHGLIIKKRPYINGRRLVAYCLNI